MPLREFALFLLASLVFAAANIVSKYAISVLGVPPLFLAAMRYLVVTLLLFWRLRPMPRPRWRVAVGTLLLGVFSFGLFYVALQHVSAASAAIVNLSQAPLGVLLAMVLLGERPAPGRLIGAALTIAGVAAVIYRPGAMAASLGLWIVLASSFSTALGSIACSGLRGIAPLRIQAWSGFLCFSVLAPASLLLEKGQWQAAVAGGWRFVAAVLFMGIVVSIFALTILFRLLQRHDANLMASLNLLMPLMTVILGVVLLGETITPAMVAGLGLSCLGVLVIAGQFDRLLPRAIRSAPLRVPEV